MFSVLFSGLLISFLGQLPFSNMNLTATLLSVQEGWKKAWAFGLGIAIVEMCYLRLSLTAMDWIVEHKLIFQIMGWLTVLLFFILGVWSLVLATKQVQEDKKGLLLDNNLNRFVLGLSVSAINPVQIPFWFIWSTNMIDNNVLHPDFAEFNAFTIGAAIGSLAGIGVYIYGGKWVIEKMKASNRQLNIFLGIVFILASMLQLYTMMLKGSILK
jgi:threonine/homoserine/homoserine lactone efflux protein